MTKVTKKLKQNFLNDQFGNLLYIASALLSIILAVTGYYNVVINGLSSILAEQLQRQTFQFVFALHLILSFAFIFLILVYILKHIKLSHEHPNTSAKKEGIKLASYTLLISISGLLLLRGFIELELPNGFFRTLVYLVHVLIPLLAIWAYYQHRQKSKQRVLARNYMRYSAYIVLFSLVTLNLTEWLTTTSTTTQNYTPSLMKVDFSHKLNPEDYLDRDYCLSCHQDIHSTWQNSAHKFSSFNNPFYKSSIMQLQHKLLDRDKSVNAAKFCAGCHDPLILMSGDFNNKPVDDKHVMANEGLTCTFCHSIQSIDSTKGNADFTVSAPIHYPFAKSDSEALRTVSDILLKSNPEFHKQTFLKPHHKTAEFCGSCHKVHIPEALNKYKWLRGQNHYDSFRLSGVSGANVNSFYYPRLKKDNCQSCHMEDIPSSDPSAKLTATGDLLVKDHQYASGNTALAVIEPKNASQIMQRNMAFLKNAVTVDIIGIREDGKIDGKFIGPISDNKLELIPNQKYVAEIVVRTRHLGHSFTNGTTDSNQIWLSTVLKQDKKVVASSGLLNNKGALPKQNVHLIKALLVDKSGQEITHRNVEDIVTAVYNHQIPPGASSVVHYRFTAPGDLTAPVSLSVSLNYRKFNKEYTNFSLGNLPPINLPVIQLSEDEVQITQSQPNTLTHESLNKLQLSRLLDYGIGLYRKPNASEFKQAEAIFKQVYAGGEIQGGVNLLRLLYAEGRLEEAIDLIEKIRLEKPYNEWVLDWYESLLAREYGEIEKSIELLLKIIESNSPYAQSAQLDFSMDDKVILALAEAYFSLAQLAESGSLPFLQAIENATLYFEKTLNRNSENAKAHYGMWKVARLLGDTATANKHKLFHQKYKRDEFNDTQAVAEARQLNPELDKDAAMYRVYDLK